MISRSKCPNEYLDIGHTGLENKKTNIEKFTQKVSKLSTKARPFVTDFVTH